MTQLESEFRSLLETESIDGLDGDAALNHVGRLIDLAYVLKHAEATDQAIKLGEGIGNRTLSPT